MKIDIQKVLFKNPQGQGNEIHMQQNSFQNVSMNANNLDFNSILSDAKIVSTQGVFQALVSQLEKQEKVLLKNPSVANISAYKRIVKNIVNEVSSNFNLESINLFSNDGYEKVVNYSKAIDEKLEFIMKDFLENNRLSLEVIDTFVDIKGMIIDLTT